MFGQRKVKKLFKNDDPRLIYFIRNKDLDFRDIFKDEEDLLAKAIRHHKNKIAEAELMTFCEDLNRTGKDGQSYLMVAIEADNQELFSKLMEKNIRLDLTDQKRQSALFYALKSDNLYYYTALRQAGVDIKGFNNDGENAAMFAYRHQKKNVALELLKENIFINHIDKDGNTILHYAVLRNDVDFALKLLELGSDVLIKNYQGQSVLDIAKELQIEEMIIEKMSRIIDQMFLENATVRISELLDEHYEIPDYSHFNLPFLVAFNAVKYNNEPIFNKVIRNVTLLNSVDYRGNSLLMYCIEFNRFLMARKILYLDVNLNLQNQEHKSAIVILLEKIIKTEESALIHSYKELFKELLECQVDVNMQDIHGNTVLMYAIEAGQADLIDALIQYPHLDLNLCNDKGQTALIIAYQLKDLATVHKIIASGRANLNLKDVNNHTLLLLAMQDDNLELFTLLLNYGADLDIRYQDGMTILMLALKQNKMRFIARIFEYHFDVDLRDDFGNTALMHAIKMKNTQSVKALLKLGANKRLPDKQGNTPIYVALDLNALDIAKLLRTSGEE